MSRLADYPRQQEFNRSWEQEEFYQQQNRPQFAQQPQPQWAQQPNNPLAWNQWAQQQAAAQRGAFGPQGNGGYGQGFPSGINQPIGYSSQANVGSQLERDLINAQINAQNAQNNAQLNAQIAELQNHIAQHAAQHAAQQAAQFGPTGANYPAGMGFQQNPFQGALNPAAAGMNPAAAFACGQSAALHQLAALGIGAGAAQGRQSQQGWQNPSVYGGSQISDPQQRQFLQSQLAQQQMEQDGAGVGWGNAGGFGQNAGRGPRNYRRNDQRIEEDVNEQLTRNPFIDAQDITVQVKDGEVTLTGQVDNHCAKHAAEHIAENTFGVRDVQNQLRLRQNQGGREAQSSESRQSPAGRQGQTKV